MLLLLSFIVVFSNIQAQDTQFYCAQFFKNIGTRDFLTFTADDNSNVGTVIAEFLPPSSSRERMFLTSPDADYVGLDDSRLLVQKSLRPVNGEHLTLEGQCDGLVLPYNVIANVNFNISVYVRDVNDAPVFENLPQRIEVYENTTVSSVVYTVKVDDTFDIQPAYWTNDIRIEKVTGLETSRTSTTRTFYMSEGGNIKLVGKLDFETGPRIYKLKIAASDGGSPPKSAMSRLVINVRDVDDMPPRFSQKSYMANVIGEKPLVDKEECFNITPPIHADDQDRRLKSDILYDIIDGEPGTREYWGTYFRVEEATGMVCQLQMIQRLLRDTVADRDVFYNFTFTIRAYQKDNPQKYDTSQLTIQVIDDNSYAPTFERRLYRKSLPEYPITTNDSTIVTVIAHDRDYGQNSVFEYSLVENPHDMFHVDSNSGQVSLVRAHLLDRELNEKVQLTVLAKELYSAEKRQDTTRVLINVRDVNDNKPEFTNATYRYSIKDTLRRGTPIHEFEDRPLALDRDSGQNGQVIYDISGVWRLGGPTLFSDLSRFMVDRDTGVIRLAGSLSDLRRKRDYPIFRLAFTATDSALRPGERLSSIADVFVKIVRANDHKPQFVSADTSPHPGADLANDTTANERHHVPEDAPIGTVVVKLNVEDEDGDEDVFLSYWISEGNGEETFDVTSDGRITLKQQLDREMNSSYELTITVSDGQYNASTDVGVFVDDVNDNAPRFGKEEYTFYLEENALFETMIGHTVASDPDLDVAGEVTYSVKYNKASDVFDIMKNGTLFVGSNAGALNRESTDSFTLKVVASDNGQPQLRSSADVTIVLTDANDNAPVFTKDIYRGTVDEDNTSPVFQSILLETEIKAVDADVSDENRQIIYSIVGPASEWFTIDRYGGHVTVAEPGRLDAEIAEEHVLEIVATDRNGTGLSATASLVLKVKDKNDNAPFFVTNLTMTIEANTAIGSVIAQISADDRDISEPNNRLIYILKNGGYGKFSVDLESGDIAVADSLIREPNHDVYMLSVHAFDGGVPRLRGETTVTIYIPANHKPEFKMSRSKIKVKENKPLGSLVGTVVANDPDAGVRNQTLTYFLDSSEKLPFKVDQSNGKIAISSALNYETRQNYQFLVYVRDDGIPSMTSSTTVSVQVDDVNDVPPSFMLPYYEGRIVEDDDSPMAKQVVLMPMNISTISPGLADLSLSLRGPDSDMFYIDPITGQIRVRQSSAGRIDREKVASYDFLLRATSKHDEKLSTDVDVTVHVLDVNDNRPFFEQPTYDFVVPEDVQVGQEIGRVQAFDADATSPNKEIMYVLEDDSYGKFKVDMKTGAVRVLSGLFYEPRYASYQLTITAMDMGSPVQKTEQLVTIDVKKDFNNYRPEFKGDSIFFVPEEVPLGTLVGNLHFVDEDLAPGETVTLEIMADTPVPFSVDSLTGELRTTARLDYDAGPHTYTFSIMASDNGYPPKEAKTTVGVILDDINDNPPRFTQAEYHHRVSSNFPAGTVVATPFAFDDIDSSQSTYSYRMEGDGAGHMFEIDPQTGVITTTDRLAEADQDMVECAIFATDIHQAALVAAARFVVDVQRSTDVGTCDPGLNNGSGSGLKADD